MDIYQEWMLWRRDNGTDLGTVKKNAIEWNRFLKSSTLSKQPIGDIDINDVEDFYRSITFNHAPYTTTLKRELRVTRLKEYEW